MRIGRANIEDKSKKEVPFKVKLDNSQDNPLYELFSITPYSSLHYMQYIKNNEHEWIGMDDETRFIIKQSLIVNLFGREEGDNPLMRCLSRDWLATILYYKKSSYDLNEINEDN